MYIGKTMAERTPNVELTTAEKRVLVLYRDHVDKYKAPPTYRWIADLLGVTHNAIVQHVKKLEAKGFLARRPVTIIRLTLSDKGKKVAL